MYINVVCRWAYFFVFIFFTLIRMLDRKLVSKVGSR